MTEENTNTTVETTDNSEVEYSDEDIAKALDDTKEPEKTESDTVEEPAKDDKADTQTEPTDNTPKYPKKFTNKDGSVDVDGILKSYSELESYKGKLEQERAGLLEYKKQVEEAQQAREQQALAAGFNSAEEMQYTYEMAAFEANEYAKYLHLTDDPEAVQRMLDAYRDNPTDELMEDIELEFAPSINKKVARATERLGEAYQAQMAQKAETGKMSNIENVIAKTVEANSDVFKYEPFKKMLTNFLGKYGDAIQPEDAIAMANTITEMKDLYRQEFEKMTGTKIANDNATDKLAGLSDNKSAPASGQPNWENLSQKELEREIAKYI